MAPKKRQSKKVELEKEEDREEQEEPEPQKEEHEQEEKYVLYKLLCVEVKATEADIKTSYRKMVLKIHPDKNKEDPLAKEKFAQLTEAYQILSNPEKRKEYDETGTLSGGEFNEATFQTAYQYYRNVYKKIEKEDIEAFEKRYRYGEMEQEDLLDYYNSHKGDMIRLLDCIPLSKNEDIPRFIQFYEKCIKDKQLQVTPRFSKTKNKVKKMVLEEEEFLQEQEKRTGKTTNSMSALVASIQGKKSGFLDMLESKYTPGSFAPKGRKKPPQ